jgi:predicted Zn-dependent protease
MARAGYDPQKAIEFWERFSSAMGSSSTPTFLRTHPVDSVRIEDLKKYLFEAKQEYKPQP